MGSLVVCVLTLIAATSYLRVHPANPADLPPISVLKPLSGVDHASATRIEAVFGELRDEGRALLVATHDVAQARAWPRVLCLNHRQVAFGTPAEVLSTRCLQETYGAELVVLDGQRAVTVAHHHH